MTTPSLFPGLVPLEVPDAQPAEQLSYGRRLTLRQRADVERGRHPLTHGHLYTGVEDATCGNCVSRTHNHRDYPKCALGPITSGPATDVRAWWPGCTRWEPSNADPKVSHDAARWRP